VPELAFVMSPNQNWFFREFVETLRYELAEQGVPSSVHTEGFPEPTPERVYAVVAPHELVALEGEEALPADAILRRTIYISAEPPGTVRLDQDIELSRRAGVVFSIHPRSVAEFWRAGIQARHLRPGYSSLLDHFDPDAQRDIDVMFLGARTRRREKYLAACAQVLAPYNSCLLFSDGSRPNPGGSPTFLAEAKWDLLPRAKILLNVHQGGEPHLEWLRVLDAIHAGAVVVTEHSGGIAPLVAGEHLFTASPESLPFILDSVLHAPERLAGARSAAYERIRSWLPLALSVSVLRAAAVELVGRPLPRHVSLGGRFTARSRLPDRWFPEPSAEADAESGALRRGLKDVSLDLIEMRRQVARLEQLVRSGDGGGSGPTVVYESPAWDLRRDPRVTVVTALYNHSALIAATLDSVSASRLREFEVVVVDDGSSDGSAEVAREWMTAHPWIPARLIAHRLNRGLGAARNTGVDAARAAYCFVLDAKDEVYPRCLDTLVGTLDSVHDVAFVYPMLEVLGAEAFAVGNGSYLQSVLGWQPERLRLGNYIEAPTMLRTDRLRELGGFTTDRRLYGWEDYDLWCRMAERGWAGQLVPQILARSRASLSAMRSTTDLSTTTAMAAVIEHAPKLMAGIQPPF